MYWYIKYPLIVILVLSVLGIGGMLWRSCVKSLPPAVPTAEELRQQEAGGSVAVTAPASSAVASKTQAAVRRPAAQTTSVVQSEIPELEARLESSRKQFDSGKLEVSRTLAQRVLTDERVVEFDRYWYRAAEMIDAVNRKVMNSTAPISEKERYVVRYGDTLGKLANRFHISVLSMMRINGLTSDRIHPRQTVMYLKGTWSIRVSKTQYLLMLYLDQKLYRIYNVGIGKDNRTPAGTFYITALQKDPAWQPSGKNIPFGDKDNILGTRWMKLTPAEGTDTSLEGYGIHGTTVPDTIGTSSSNGCVRLRNPEVEELFDFIPEAGGSIPPVKVVIEE